MRRVIYICDCCGTEYEEKDLEKIITIGVSRLDAHIDVFYDTIHAEIKCGRGHLHFCDTTCVAVFIEEILEVKRKQKEEIL